MLVNAKFRLQDPDGAWRWTNVRAAPVLDADGSIVKWAGMNFNIDDRKRAEVALREGEERQAFLLKLSDGLRPFTDAPTIQQWASRILRQQLRAYRAWRGQATIHEFQGRRPSDGAPRWIRNIVFPLYDAHERVQGVGGIAEDLTEAKRSTDRQEVLVAELQHRSRNLLGVITTVAG